MKSADVWERAFIRCGVRSLTATMWAEVFAAGIGPDTFSAGEAEVPWFVGQVLHESQLLERTEENLNYSAVRLTQVWPKRFPTVESARPYAFNTEALANRAYGGRLGNTEPGDGFRYRGRGIIQVTGRANYEQVGASIGIDLVDNPDLMTRRPIALAASIAWWEGNVPDSAVGNIQRVTRIVNGGTHGLDERTRLTDTFARYFR